MHDREARKEAGNLEQADGAGAGSDASEGVCSYLMRSVKCSMSTHRGGRCRQQPAFALPLRQLASINCLRCVCVRCFPLSSVASCHACVSASHGMV